VTYPGGFLGRKRDPRGVISVISPYLVVSYDQIGSPAVQLITVAVPHHLALASIHHKPIQQQQARFAVHLWAVGLCPLIP
jgi:hypothetical protein